MTTVALMPIAEEADAAVAYAEGTVSWNIKMMLMTQGKSQTALADALGVQRAAISKKIRGSVSWSLADLVRAADFLDTDISTLLDDSLMKQLQGMGNRKATGDTPMASGELLRLGLNQRPSDIRFWLAAVGLFCNRSRQYTSLAVPSNRRVIAHVRLAAGFPKSIGQKRAIVFLGK